MRGLVVRTQFTPLDCILVDVCSLWYSLQLSLYCFQILPFAFYFWEHPSSGWSPYAGAADAAELMYKR